MYADNIFISLHDEDENTLSFPYYIDQYDDFQGTTEQFGESSLTCHCILEGIPILFEKNDLLAFIPLVKNNELQFPWYVSGWEEEYYRISEVERIIKCIDTIMSMEETAFKALSADQQKNVLVIRYENLVEQTNNEIHRMEQFLNRKSSNRMPDIMLRENCPSEISLEKRMEKMNNISTKASKKYIDLLLSRSEAYEATSNLL